MVDQQLNLPPKPRAIPHLPLPISSGAFAISENDGGSAQRIPTIERAVTVPEAKYRAEPRSAEPSRVTYSYSWLRNARERKREMRERGRDVTGMQRPATSSSLSRSLSALSFLRSRARVSTPLSSSSFPFSFLRLPLWRC